ncbi:MAG: lytic transglycosylase domain-containing protein [Acidobacteriaceae bacterium]|nr:lytic transglycosylase domain-containing protein [Acidobacteriaceae bacterium]
MESSHKLLKPKTSILAIAFGVFVIATTVTARQVKEEEKTSATSAPLEVQRKSLLLQQNSVHGQLSQTPARKPMLPDDFIAPMTGSPDDFISPLIPPVSLPPDCPPLKSEEIAMLVNEAASAQQVKPELIRAVMKQESGFKPCVVSPKGAEGLMQLMPETARAFNVSDPFDPKQNALGGTAFLKQLMTKYKDDLKLALGAYNAGANAVDNAAGGLPDTTETQNYVSSILAGLEAEKTNSTSSGEVPKKQ